MVLQAYLPLVLADLLILYGSRGEVSSNSAESPRVSPVNVKGSDESRFRPVSSPAFG